MKAEEVLQGIEKRLRVEKEYASGMVCICALAGEKANQRAWVVVHDAFARMLSAIDDAQFKAQAGEIE